MPLKGIRIVDFGWSAAGGLMGKWLGQFGAEVIKVETHTRPCVLRTMPPYKYGVPDVDSSAYFSYFNDSRLSISLNLNHTRGVEILKRLVALSNMVIENFTVGTLERWGLDYENLKKVKPDIILLSVPMQGLEGPDKLMAGYGYTLQSLAGITHVTGWPDRAPAPGLAYTDYFTAPLAVAAAVAALNYHQRIGRGQHIEVSQFEASVHGLSSAILDYTANRRVQGRIGNRSPYAAPHGAYRCKGDDRWCTIAVCTEEEWKGFCNAIGNPTWTQARFGVLAERKRNEDELDRLVEEWTVDREAEEVMAIMQKNGVAAGVVQNVRDLMEDPQFKHRQLFSMKEHLTIGNQTYCNPLARLSKTPGAVRGPGPVMGQYNEYVYKELLGISETEYQNLSKDGVFE